MAEIRFATDTASAGPNCYETMPNDEDDFTALAVNGHNAGDRVHAVALAATTAVSVMAFTFESQ